MPESKLFINTKTMRKNLDALRLHLPHQTRLMGMVKGRGYGTDPILLAKFYALSGIDILGVAHLHEGIELRKNGIQTDLFVFSTPLFETELLVNWGFEAAVSEEKTIESLALFSKKLGKITKVHLHIDTGMSRLGAHPKKALALATLIDAATNLKFEGVMTHFACAGSKAEDPFTKKQIARFKSVVSTLQKSNFSPCWIHAANSSGALRFRLPFCNMVRIGLAPFGVGITSDDANTVLLKNALSLETRIVGINECKKGESVSYDRSFIITKKHARIGIIPIGYCDGWHRNFSNKGFVCILGKKAPIVGVICMDFMMCDLTEIPEAAIGDRVVLFDADHLPDEVAQEGNTIVNELIGCLGPRIERNFTDESN